MNLSDNLTGNHGTFVISDTGALVSGSVESYETLVDDIREADPETMSAIFSIIPVLVPQLHISEKAGLTGCGVVGMFALAAVAFPLADLGGILGTVMVGLSGPVEFAAACGGYIGQQLQ